MGILEVFQMVKFSLILVKFERFQAILSVARLAEHPDVTDFLSVDSQVGKLCS